MTAWRPEPGQKLSGTVVALDESTNFKGDPYPIVKIDVGGTITTVHALHEVLQQELAKRRPTIGDQLSISYHGQPDGKDYHHYTVTGGTEPTIDWSRYADPNTQPSPDPTSPTRAPAPAPAPEPVVRTDPGQAALDGTAGEPDGPMTTEQRATIRALLDVFSNTAAQECIRIINRQARGPWSERLTRHSADRTIAWLAAKGRRAGLDVDRALPLRGAPETEPQHPDDQQAAGTDPG